MKLEKILQLHQRLYLKNNLLPASAVNCVEPSATVTACQSICFNVVEPPNDKELPFIVIDEFVNLSLPIVPVAILAFVTELAAKSAR